MTDRSSLAIGESTPVKLSCSLTKCTDTPRAVRSETRRRRSSRLRARRSRRCTTTVSPARTKPTSASSWGRTTSLPEARSVKTRSTSTVSLEPAVADRAKQDEAAGRAKSLSSWLNEAARAHVEREDLGAVLAELLAETGGPLSPAELAEAGARLATAEGR